MWLLISVNLTHCLCSASLSLAAAVVGESACPYRNHAYSQQPSKSLVPLQPMRIFAACRKFQELNANLIFSWTAVKIIFSRGFVGASRYTWKREPSLVLHPHHWCSLLVRTVWQKMVMEINFLSGRNKKAIFFQHVLCLFAKSQCQVSFWKCNQQRVVALWGANSPGMETVHRTACGTAPSHSFEPLQAAI